MNKRRFSRSVRFLLFVPILMILLLVSSGGLVDAQQEPQGPARDIQGVVMDDFACWTSGPVSKGDRRLRSDTNLWGEKEDEFVVDQRDLGDVARFNMKVYPEYLEDLHHWDKSKLLKGDDYDNLSEIEKDELAESLAVYTLFDSVPELVDYVFALDVFYTGTRSDRNIYDRRVRMLAAQMPGLITNLLPLRITACSCPGRVRSLLLRTLMTLIRLRLIARALPRLGRTTWSGGAPALTTGG